MKKILLLLCGLWMMGLSVASAQQTFMDNLVKTVSGQGNVRVFQEAEIARLVNGKAKAETVRPVVQATEETTVTESKPKRLMKATGYRIQVYAGGNSRTARQEAQQMAEKVKTYFSDLPTYTNFQSPRWTCRVGDFRTYEEANQALHELRATKQFDEALIVKSVIQIPY